MRALLTAGAGFIGSALYRLLLQESDMPPFIIDKLTYAGDLREGADARGAVTFLRGDINDRALLNDAFARSRPDVVFHLAAESHVDRSITSSADFIRTNIGGTHVLLQAARVYFAAFGGADRDAFRFVQVSTDDVFGALGETGAFTHETPHDLRPPYSASKAASDHLVMAWGHTYRLPVLLSNCSNNYGPYHPRPPWA